MAFADNFDWEGVDRAGQQGCGIAVDLEFGIVVGQVWGFDVDMLVFQMPTGDTEEQQLVADSVDRNWMKQELAVAYYLAVL